MGKNKKTKKDKIKQPMVMICCVNNSGFRNEYSTNSMFGIGWFLGANGIKAASYTFDSHPICYDDKTEILTAHGWKYFKDLKKNIAIATLNKDNHHLEYQFPDKIISMPYQGKMFKVINSRKVDLVVTPNHKMFVSKYKSANDWYPFELIKAKEIINKKVKYKRDAIWEGKDQEFFYLPALSSNTKRKDQRVPREIPMDDWLEFFGYWLAEGCTSKYTKNGHYTVNITQFKDIGKRKKIRDCIGKLFNYDEATYGQFRINNKQLWNYLKQFGHAQDKFIPIELLQLSKRQLNILLEALMLGDGYSRNRITTDSINPSLERMYTTTSKQLANNVQEILLKIGISGNIRILKHKGKQGNLGKANFDEIMVKFIYKNTPQVHEPSDSSRATNQWINYNGMIYCVEVSNHIIYVRRNGIPIWSGNSVARNEACEVFLKSKEFTHIFFIDSDSVPKADIVIRLLQHDKPIVSGWYLSRARTGLPVVLKIITKNTPKCLSCIIKKPSLFPEYKPYKLEELMVLPREKKTGLIKVDAVGAGALLIRRDALSHLEKPYFYEDHLNPRGFGEDLFFGLNCKFHKVPIHIDLNAFVSHFTWGLIDMRHVRMLIQRAKRDAKIQKTIKQ